MEPAGSSENVARLQQEHTKAMESNKERIKKWETFKSDYECLQARLYTLPDKISHDIMVPFGKYAFMPGQLYHTNEVLVLLGDNWFAKRSTKQATEIIQRRKQSVIKHLDDERMQLQDWEARFAFTKDFESESNVEEHKGTVEIKEEYKPTGEEVQTKGRVRKALKPGANVPPPRRAFPRNAAQQAIVGESNSTKQTSKPTAVTGDSSSTQQTSQPSAEITSAKQPSKPGVGKDKDHQTDEDLWSRLDQLELIETDGDHERTKELAAEGSGRLKQEKKPVITVQHAAVASEESEDNKSKTSPLQDEADDEDRKPLFSNPGDIFKRFCRPEIEQELKEDDSADAASAAEKSVKWDPQLESHPLQSVKHVAQVPCKPKTDHSKLTPTPMAFSGQVIERPGAVTETSKSEAGPRKVSKFKASRIHK